MPKKFFYRIFDDSVPKEIDKAYNKLLRHEQYLEEKERKYVAFSFGSESDLYLCKKFNVFDTLEDEKESEDYALLYKALDSLKAYNERDYNIVIDYYFSTEKKATCKALGEKYHLSPQSISARLKVSRKYLRKCIEILKRIENEKSKK